MRDSEEILTRVGPVRRGKYFDDGRMTIFHRHGNIAPLYVVIRVERTLHCSSYRGLRKSWVGETKLIVSSVLQLATVTAKGDKR